MKLPRLCAAMLFAGVMVINLWWATPMYNWDMLAYVACVHSYTESDAEAIHSKTFDEVRRHVPENAYDRLTRLDAYRRALAQTPTSFIQHIPFYSVKPAYPCLMFLLKQILLMSVNFILKPMREKKLLQLQSGVF